MKFKPKNDLEVWVFDHVSQEQAEVELFRRWGRWQCRTNLYFLAKEVMDQTELDVDFHGKQCSRLNRWSIRQDGRPYPIMADYWPRGSFKTTIGTMVRGTQTYLRCTEETIQIRHGDLDKAGEILGKIRWQFENNEKLRWFFPDLTWPKGKAPSGVTWTKEALTLPRLGGWQEATFTISSFEATAVSGHYTFIIFDDWVYDTNTNSAEMMRKVYEKFRVYKTFKDERRITRNYLWRPWYDEHQFWEWKGKGELWIPFKVGIMATRWDARDANSKILDPESTEWAGKVDANIIVACVDQDGNPDPGLRDGSRPIFPGRFDLDELRDIRDEVGPYQFSAQYMQNPYPADAQIFKKEWFKLWTDNPDGRAKKLPKNIRIFTAVDPNVKSDQSDADHGVVMTAAIDAYENIFILKIGRKQFAPGERVQEILKHVRMFGSERVFYETTASQENEIHWLKEKAEALDLTVRVKKIPRGGRGALSKERRIQSIEPHVANGRIHVKQGDATMDALITEATQWRPKHEDPDDQLDCLVDLVENMKPPVFAKAERDAKVAESREDLVARENAQTGAEVLALIGVTKSPRGPRLQHLTWEQIRQRQQQRRSSRYAAAK